jgi:RNA polymerase sigma factor (sigma-70 family)
MNLVYSAALRKTGRPDTAEDITQAVFILLAQKAARLPRQTILAGWLYQTTRLTASGFLRSEARRIRREQEAHMQSELHTAGSEEAWAQLAPLLEDAMGHLDERERAAIVLRFFGGNSFAEVATAAGVSEKAAKKRVPRALEKLHRYFTRRGVSPTTAMLAGMISAHAVQAAPAGLAQTVTVVAAGGSTLTLIKGALKIMAWTKMKTAVVAAVIVVATATTSVVGSNLVRSHRVLQERVINDVQADGTCRSHIAIEMRNSSKQTLNTLENTGIFQIEKTTDAAGQPVQFTSRKEGDLFRQAMTCNHPIPPGGKIAFSIDGEAEGLVKPAGEPGVFQYQNENSPGFDGDTHCTELDRLPVGAVLLDCQPPDMQKSTRDGRIELRMDKIIPPGGDLEISYRYRLEATAKPM